MQRLEQRTVNIEIVVLYNYSVFLKLAVFLIIAPGTFRDFYGKPAHKPNAKCQRL